jgi:zinc transport system permease protein
MGYGDSMDVWYSLVSWLPFEWATFAFMKNALLAILLVSPLFALLGCMVISNQMAFFSDAIGHAALTGIAIGMIVGLADPLWAMVGFALVLALVITVLRRYSAASADTTIGLVMAFTVALGIVLLSRGGGFARYSRYLIGDILSITPGEILRLVVLCLAVLVAWLLMFNKIFMVFLNRSLARSRTIRVWRIEAFFAAVVAVVVTVCIPWVGLMVINALLILPAASARNVARSTPQYVWIAIVFSVLAGIAGLVSSFYWETATGATVVLFSMAIYVLSVGARRLRGG